VLAAGEREREGKKREAEVRLEESSSARSGVKNGEAFVQARFSLIFKRIRSERHARRGQKIIGST